MGTVRDCKHCHNSFASTPGCRGFCSLRCRFYSKVFMDRDASACWTWTGSRNSDGYGSIRMSGGASKAHRVAWELENGSIRAGVHVLHRCDNPSCVRPDHLFLGDHDANMRDKSQKGRAHRPLGTRHPSVTHPHRVAQGDRHGSKTTPERVPRGERSGRAKLTEAQVREIRARAASGEPQSSIGRSFGVYQGTISQIVLRRSWSHVV